MYVPPIDLVQGLTVNLWDAIDKWAAIPATEETLEARVAAAADVEKAVTTALNLHDLINARMVLDRMAHRLRDGGPNDSRGTIRQQVTLAADMINKIVPRSPLR